MAERRNIEENTMTRPVLYHVPPSFYSQIVRLALAEKGIEYDSQYVIPGPSSYESYAPWYMRLNRGGTVPTLAHDGKVVSDSRDILRHLDSRFPGANLWQKNSCNRTERVDHFVQELYAISFRELSYGSPALLRLGVWINKKRVQNLRQRQREAPQLTDLYDAKIEDIENFSRNALDADRMRQAWASHCQKLDRLENALWHRTHIVGNDYTMADLVWTVGIARLKVLGMNPFEGRPALKKWYARMKARPSFRQAQVMERFQPSAILRVLWSKLKKRLLGRRPRTTPIVEVSAKG